PFPDDDRGKRNGTLIAVDDRARRDERGDGAVSDETHPQDFLERQVSTHDLPQFFFTARLIADLIFRWTRLRLRRTAGQKNGCAGPIPEGFPVFFTTRSRVPNSTRCAYRTSLL